MVRLQQLVTKYQKELIAGIIFALALCLFSFGYAFAAVDPVRSIRVTSRNTNYENSEEGSWQVTKSGYWTGYGKAEVTLDVDTTLMANNQYTDIIFVLDISGSMSGEKLGRVKSDSKELISSLLSNKNNRAALITFDTESRIVSELTNDEELLTNEIDNLQPAGTTNYYQALVNVDNLLHDYQKESGREMIVLFLTDGYPNEDTPNQIAQYQYLKQAYSYITINGIQYEMGDSILNPIKEISDNQFIADMETLNNVLFDASVTPVTYDTYQIIDYIDNDNFTLESVNDINVTIGSVELTDEEGKQKIIWTMDDLSSGRKANLTMKLKLKDELVGQGGIYPTNESTQVISKIDNQNENEITTNTPILSDDYQVIYDGNAPEGCTVSNVPGSNQYSVYRTVEISDATPVCEGYQFKGWKIATKDVEKINNDYFTMPEADVEIKAEWSKLSTTKTMEGEVYVSPTLYNFMKKEAVMDNISSEFVSSSSGIDFGRAPSDTNGKGVYTRVGTEGNEYPILYFRGDIDNNHVKFGGFCWKIVRTTETGGVKLIYDGVPDSNGYCNNTGTASQIGTRAFNSTYRSPADVGYMVGTRYEYDYEDVEWFDLVGKSEIYTSGMSSTNYYYADSVTYSDGTYTLVNPVQYSWSDNYQNLEGKYTCRSDSATSCSEVYYVNDAYGSNTMYRVDMTNGETYDSLYQEASELTWIYGNDVTWNGSSYTLVDTVESRPINWSSDMTNVVRKGHRYTCLSSSNTCSTVYYVHYTGSSTSIYYMTLNNGVNIERALNEMLTTNQTDSTIKTYIDTWYSNNMTEYTKYLEDTVWCNDRSIYQLNDWDKDYTGTSYNLYFGPYGNNTRSPYVSDLSCPSLVDSFTVSSENGNGKLTYPVALLTADEITLAGSGWRGYSSSSYLNTRESWWSLSPYSFNYNYAGEFFVSSSGDLNYGNVVSNTGGVRPSVSLAPGILVSRGTGTSENPYELVLE